MDGLSKLTVKLHRTSHDTLDVKWSAYFCRPKTAIIFVESPASEEWVSVVRDVSSIRINTTDLGIPGVPTVTVQGCSSSSSSTTAGINNYRVDNEGSASTETAVIDSFEIDETPTTSLNGLHQIHGAPKAVTVALNIDAMRSRLAASVSYSVRWNDPRPDKWMITVRNMTWRLNDKWYNEWIYVVDQSVTNFQPPLWFRPGNRYSVTVRGLKVRPSCSAADDALTALTTCFGEVSLGDQNARAGSYSVMYKATAEFRAGEALSLAEMRMLHDKAVSYIQSSCFGFSLTNVCERMYRNKDRSYFDKVLGENGGWMRGYTKDATGDVRSPINGEFSGLFFMASARMGKSNSQSPFGNTRVYVDAQKLLELAPNVYFADFYCLNRKDHYVTLVLTRLGSDADQFCQQHLPRLDVYDASNKIMFYSDGQLKVAGTVFTEVFLTEDVPVQDLINAGRAQMEYGIPTFARGSTTQGGRMKNGCCGAGCNPFSYSVPCQPSGYELF